MILVDIKCVECGSRDVDTDGLVSVCDHCYKTMFTVCDCCGVLISKQVSDKTGGYCRDCYRLTEGVEATQELFEKRNV